MRERERKKRVRTNLEPGPFFKRNREEAESYIRAAKLAALPEYDCPICGEKTIFKSGCGTCYADISLDDSEEGNNAG